MSVPPDKMMELIKNQQPGGAPAPNITPESQANGMSDSSTAPMGTPMSTPEPKMGNKEGAMVNLSMAQDLLEQALPSVGSDSEEGKAILNAINVINKVIGPRKGKTKELQQSEILQMLQNLPQAGGATPEGTAMSKAPAVPNMPPMPAMAAAGPTPQPSPAQ
jgi:hypothetical protein